MVNVRAAISDISSTLNLILKDESTICDDVEILQTCIENAESHVVVIPPGEYALMKGLLIPSNTKVVIQKGAKIILSDDADMPHKGGYVIGIVGSPEKTINNVTLIHNGVIDGNKKIHPYERSGNEGIKIDYGNHITIFGDGVVRNVSGDGVDYDVTSNSVLIGIQANDNSGSGIHFGSGRPLKSSHNVQVIGVSAKNNGVRVQRYGLDVSWPNLEAVTYGWSYAENNYRNWGIVGSGSEVFKSVSIDGKNNDILNGARTYEINDSYEGNIFTNIDYTNQLIRRDLRLFLGKNVPEYLIPLNYNREK